MFGILVTSQCQQLFAQNISYELLSKISVDPIGVKDRLVAQGFVKTDEKLYFDSDSSTPYGGDFELTYTYKNFNTLSIDIYNLGDPQINELDLHFGIDEASVKNYKELKDRIKSIATETRVFDCLQLAVDIIEYKDKNNLWFRFYFDSSTELNVVEITRELELCENY